MSGALTERVFVTKLNRVGFADARVHERRPFSLADAATYPLFTPDLIDMIRDLVPADRHDALAMAVTLTARKPG